MSKLASDDGASESVEHIDEAPPSDVEQATTPAGEAEAPDPRPWLEPQIQTLAIFTELFRTGDRTEAELEQLLSRYTTTMAWTDFWAKEGYIAEVVKGSERHFGLSGKAVLVLELP